MRNALPINMMGHRDGPARALRHRGQPLEPVAHREDEPVKQIEQLVRISREFGREVATGKEAREICKIGVFYDTRGRDAGRQRLRAERQGPAAGLPAQGRVSDEHGTRNSHSQRRAAPKSCGWRRSPSAIPAPARRGCATSRSASISPTPTSAPASIRCRCPNGIGVEASGIVEAVGEGVTNVAPGDRVTYTGFLNTLGAYSTERVIPAAPLIKLPPAISCETAAAMTMRGLTSAYLMRRIWPLKAGDTILLHAAAGGVGLIVSQWAKILGLTVIGTVSTEAKAEVARAHGCDHVINYAPRRRREARARADGRRRRVGRLRQRRQGHVRRLARFAEAARAARVRGHGLGPDPADRRDAAGDQGLACSSRGRRSPTTSPIPRRRARWPASCSATSPRAASGSRSTSATGCRTRRRRTAISNRARPPARRSS